ncbi:hypothetical protein ABLN67_18860, partial [Mycobacterium tuberculosis]
AYFGFESWVFNRFIYRREWVFAFIVKRFRVFRAPLHSALTVTLWVRLNENAISSTSSNT